jgi:iron complex transport system substrate-binding protein
MILMMARRGPYYILDKILCFKNFNFVYYYFIMGIQRIVTLDPSATEAVSFLDGSTSRIFGVSDKCDFPPEVKLKPKVVRSLIKVNEEMSSLEIDREVKRHLASGKPLYEIDWEKINEIKPELVVGQSICGVCAFPVSSLLIHQSSVLVTAEELNVFDYSPRNFDEIFQKIYELGKILERENRADELIKKYQYLKRELRGLGKSMKIVMIEWLMPIYVAGLWISQIIEMSGATSLLASGEEGRQMNWDIIRNFNPDIIFISPCGFSIERTLKEIDLLFVLPGWKEIKAKLNKNIYVVDSVYTSRSSPRILEFVKNFIEVLRGNEPRKEVMIRIE